MQDEVQAPRSNKVSVPIAIVVAGALIGGAIYLSHITPVPSANVKAQANDTNQNAEPVDTEISIPPITANDHMMGNPNAQVTLLTYTDLECPFCKTFHNTMQAVLDSYAKGGKVAWVYRDFPIDQLHPRAPKEAEAAECVATLGGESAYWTFVNKLFVVTPSNNGLDPEKLPELAKEAGVNVDKFNDCLSSGQETEKVRQEYTDAVKAGGNGTPYSVFISKNHISGDTAQLVESLSANFPPGTLVVSKDNYRIAMSGALPYQLIDQVLKSLLK